MEPEFITYQKFNDVGLANELSAVLEKHQIKYLQEEQAPAFDPTFTYNPLLKEYVVKVRAEDFERINHILKDEESKNIADVDKDYYLFSFTNHELMGVVTKADEWSPFDVVLSRKLLTERGITINEKELAEIDEKRIEELRVTEPLKTYQIVVGYIFACGGGLIGLFIGWHIATYKKTLPDGERVYGYTNYDREHGRMIFYISIVAFVIALLYRFGIIFN